MSERPASSGVTGAMSLQSVLPILAFLVANRLGGLRWAVVTATVLSLYVIINRRRHGLRVGIVMPVVTAVVIVRGVIGVVTGSEALYFGIGIGMKFAVAVILGLSVVVGRPLAAQVAPYVLELTPQIQAHPAFGRAMAAATTTAAGYYLLSASFDWWLFRRSSVEGFVIIRFLANWPLSTAALLIGFTLAGRRLKQIPAVDSPAALLEARLQHYWPAAPEPPETTT